MAACLQFGFIWQNQRAGGKASLGCCLVDCSRVSNSMIAAPTVAVLTPHFLPLPGAPQRGGELNGRDPGNCGESCQGADSQADGLQEASAGQNTAARRNEVSGDLTVGLAVIDS